MYPTLEKVKEIAASGEYHRIPVCKELYADRYTPVEVMRVLRKASKHCYLLESASQTEVWGRFSFLGYEPAMEITCTDGVLNIRKPGEDMVVTKKVEHPGDTLREIIEQYKTPVMEELPSFTGGLVGYFSYDYIKYSEPTLRLDAKDEEGFQDVNLMLFHKVIAFDNYRQKLILITGVRLDGDLEENYENAQRELEEMERLIRSGAKAVFKPLKLEEEFQPGAEKAEYCRWWKKQKNISGKVIFSRWFFLIHLRQRQKEVFLILTGYCGHRIRHLICSTSQVTISKWQELRRKRLRSLKMERSAPSRWQEQDPVERRRRKIRGWNENCWQMKKNWQNITCL